MRDSIDTSILGMVAKSRINLISLNSLNAIKFEIFKRRPDIRPVGSPTVISVKMVGKAVQKDDLNIRLKMAAKGSTIKPRLECFRSQASLLEGVEPHIFFPQLKEYIIHNMGGDSEVVLIVNRLHLLSHSEIIFFLTSLSLSKLPCGTIMIFTPDYIKMIVRAFPKTYYGFFSFFDLGIIHPWEVSEPAEFKEEWAVEEFVKRLFSNQSH